MKKLLPIVVVIMIATLVLTACGAGPTPSGGVQSAPTESGSKPAENKPAAQPTQPPVEKPAPTKVEASPTPEVFKLDNVTAGLNELNSYKASFAYSFGGTEDGEFTSGTFTVTEEFVKNPPAKHTTIAGIGGNTDSDGLGMLESIEVNGKQYSRIGGMCTQITAENAPQSNTTLDPGNMTGGFRGAQKVGNETINGVPAVHYKTDFESSSTGLTYVSGNGDAWIAQEGNFVVKYMFDGVFRDDTGFFCNFTSLSADKTKVKCGPGKSEFNVKYDYDITDVNQPIDIQPPADCGGAAEDIPMMADAQGTAVVGDTTLYSSGSSFEEAMAFYEKEMKANGWTEAEGGMSAEGVSIKNYTKDGRTLQVIIHAESNDKTSVTITESK